MKEKCKFYKGKIFKAHYVAFEDGFIMKIECDKKKLVNISLWENKNDLKKFAIRGLEVEITHEQFKKELGKQFGESGMALIKKFERLIKKK